MKAKTILVITPEEVGILVANGTAEIGVQQFQLLMSIADIELVGPLPSALQETIVFSAAIMADTKNAEAAKALVNFLRTPEAAAVQARPLFERGYSSLPQCTANVAVGSLADNPSPAKIDRCPLCPQ